MQVHSDINNLPLFTNAVITIGTFDGVHTGHLQIINQLKKEANSVNGETVIVTFDPHPRMVLKKSLAAETDKAFEEIKILTTLSEKTALLKKQAIDHLVIVPFTISFSEQSAEEYIRDFLVEKFHPHSIIIGYDHRFGNNRNGDYKLLEEYQEKYNYKVKEIPEHVLHNVIISSTKIRHSLSEGNIDDANEALGYSYFFEGKVIEGNKLGRTLGYPTANIEITDNTKLIPCNGVYAVEVTMEKSQLFKGMMNVGIRPTIGGIKRVIEVNIFDFNQSIYNDSIVVHIKKYLRPEIKFSGLEKLKFQLGEDKINALNVLNEA